MSTRQKVFNIITCAIVLACAILSAWANPGGVLAIIGTVCYALTFGLNGWMLGYDACAKDCDELDAEWENVEDDADERDS